MTRIMLMLALGSLASCKIANEESCQLPENADEPECNDVDPNPPCTEPADCSAPTPLCNTSAGVCVTCLSSGDCAGITPVCNTAAGTCQACVTHDECGSALCLPDGACGVSEEIAYIAAGGNGPDCTQAAPCGDFDTAMATNRDFIKVTGAISVDNAQEIDDSVAVFAERGASLTRSNDGPILQVTAGTVTIYDLEVFGAGDNSDGIALIGPNIDLTLERVLVQGNEGRGVSTANTSGSGKLTIRRSLIVGNLDGGVHASQITIDFTNNIIALNGSGGVNSGGVILDPIPGSIFEFNTIAKNVSSSAGTDGVSCVGEFPAANNIVVGNTLGSQCTFTFTMHDADTPTAIGEGNFMGQPRFEREALNQLRDPLFFRIKTDSDAIDAANSEAGVDVDIDGETRAGVRDVGADERQ